MGEVFGTGYASQYDLLYSDKDYRAECDLLEAAFRRYGDGQIQSVLDLGCGTGNHAIPLAERGYRVTGVDLSDSMLGQARAKAGTAGVDIRWKQGDVRTVEVGQTFDACLCMFAVLGYQLTNSDVLAALRTARRHVRSGGLFLFDVWFGPAVLSIQPSERAKVIPTAEGKVIRVAGGTLDVRRQICQVRYHLWQLSGDRLQSETEELHEMRFFFAQELELMLQQSGFETRSLTAFPYLDQPADESTWNVLGVAL